MIEEIVIAVADPGFSQGGCANSQIGIILQFFGRKLHENERIWTGGRPWRPLRSANAIIVRNVIFVLLVIYEKLYYLDRLVETRKISGGEGDSDEHSSDDRRQ